MLNFSCNGNNIQYVLLFAFSVVQLEFLAVKSPLVDGVYLKHQMDQLIYNLDIPVLLILLGLTGNKYQMKSQLLLQFYGYKQRNLTTLKHNLQHWHQTILLECTSLLQILFMFHLLIQDPLLLLELLNVKWVL